MDTRSEIERKIKEQQKKLLASDRELIEKILDLLTWHNSVSECQCDTCKAAIWYLKLKKEMV